MKFSRKSRRVNLNNIAIAAPCNASWQVMTGTDRERTCHTCQTKVYNLNAMTKSDAEAFLQSKIDNGESYCLKLSRRTDGTIITKDCPISRQIFDRSQRQIKIAVAAILGLFHLCPAWAQQQDQTPSHSVERFGMGGNGEGALTILKQDSIPDQLQENPGRPQADTTVLGIFNKALALEKENKSFMALQYYNAAMTIMRNNRRQYDPKFTLQVAGRYASLLRKLSYTEDAKAVEKEFCVKPFAGEVKATPQGS